MPKSPETFEKVAATFKKKGDHAWATAKSDPDRGDQYNIAKVFYDTAQRAKESAERARSEKK